MAHVAALYRYPVKGFTPESPDHLVVRPDGRIEGDRVLTFRFGNAPPPQPTEHGLRWPKTDGLAMQDTPSIGPLQLTYDTATRTVRIDHEGTRLVEAPLDDAGRAALCDAVAKFVLDTPEGDRLRVEGRLPLVLEGDGVTSQFQDRPRGFISVHGRGSLIALGEALGPSGDGLDERRFRSNVAVDGLAPWEELEWGGRVRIGEVEFEVSHHIVRCLATHANPDTGLRDAEVLTTLTRVFGQDQPTFGTLLLPTGAAAERGGTIRIGDEVQLLG
jgi:uncharacterized protein